MSNGPQNQFKSNSELNSATDANQAQETMPASQSHDKIAATPRIVQRLVHGPRGLVKANEVIALQRTIGNQAVQRLIKERHQNLSNPTASPQPAEIRAADTTVQRRVPKLNADVNASVLNNPKARKKLVQAMKRIYDKLNLVQKTDVQTILTALGTGIVAATVFNAPAAATDLEIQAIRKAIKQAYLNNGGANKLGVYYPTDNIQNGKPLAGSAETIMLNAQIPNALAILNALATAAAGSNEQTILTNIFGNNTAQRQAAKTIFLAAHAMLTTLHNDLAGIDPARLGFKVDNRLEGKPQHVGGSSPPGGPIFLTPGSFINPANLLYTLVHESTHAGNGTVIDHFYLDAPGYSNAIFDKKITNASHFEEAARQLQGNMPHRVLVPGPAPVPPGGIPAITLEAKAEANRFITRAWVKAYNAHLTLQTMARAQNGPGYVFGNRQKIDRYSHILGLTIHTHPGAVEPRITNLDLAIAEDRVGKLGNVMGAVGAVNLATIQDNRTDDRTAMANFFMMASDAITRKAHLMEKILLAALTAAGSIRKDIAKDLLMIQTLHEWDRIGNGYNVDPPAVPDGL